MNINGDNTSDNITNGIITNSSTSGSFNITCNDNTLYDLQTPNNGNNTDVLTTDGAGNTYWASGGGGNPFNQSLNTTDDVIFNKVSSYAGGGILNFNELYPKQFLDLNIGTLNTDILRLGGDGVYLTQGDLYGVNTLNANSFVKTSGTNQQYLMADGSSLQYSANSGNSNFYLYNSTVGITTPPPTLGHIGYNNAIQANATILYISHQTRDNIDIDIFLEQLSATQDVYLQDQTNSLNYIRYNITGPTTIIQNSYITIPVSLITGAGTGLTSFGVNHNILVSFFTNSIEVDLRLTTLENKTLFQSVVAGVTTFTGGTYFDAGFNNQQIFMDFGTAINRIISNAFGALADLTIQTTGLLVDNKVVCNQFINPTGLSTQFLKADGSLDGNTYLTASSPAIRYKGYIFNPMSHAVSTIPSGNKSYFFTVRINRPTIITGFSLYLSTGADPVRCAIYRNFIRASPVQNSTLVGQSASVPAATRLPYLSGDIIPVVGQNLSFDTGEYMIIGFGSQGTTNSFYSSTNTGITNPDIAFNSITNYVAGGFPTTLTAVQQSSNLPNKLCLELY